MEHAFFWKKLLSPFAGLALLALVAGGCGAPAAPDQTASAPTAAPPTAVPQPSDRLYIRDGFKGDAERLAVIDSITGARERELPPGVVAPDWATLYVAESEAGKTHLRALGLASGATLRETTLDGAYQLPMTTPDGVLGGLSPDGRWLALVANRPQGTVKPSGFAVIDTSFKQQARIVDLPGIFTFDGLSNGATSLFLTESLTDDPHGKYQVRHYDLQANALDPNVVVAKGESQIMNGTRQTAVASPDGRWLYSLYINPQNGPFIHALMMDGPVAFCLDLPKTGKDDLQKQSRWSLALSSDGRSLYAVNGALGLIARAAAGTNDSIPEIKNTGTLFEPPASAAGGAATPATSSVTTLAPDGRTLYTLGDSGLLAIDTGALKLRGRYLNDWKLDGLALSPDGARLYAASAAQGKIVRLDPLAGTIAAEVPAAGTPTGLVRVESGK